MTRFTALAAVFFLLAASVADAEPKPVEVPEPIKVPEGHRLVAEYKAKGVQVYRAVAGKDGNLAWEFLEPIAELIDTDSAKAGSHYSGPAWEAADGSKVIKEADKKVQSADAPKQDRDLPWLLIPVKADDLKDAKPGRFTKVVYVQRIETSGGLAPKELPKRAGTKIAVPYTAVYYFWAKAETESEVQFKEGPLVTACRALYSHASISY
jgi:hypothetical protein